MTVPPSSTANYFGKDYRDLNNLETNARNATSKQMAKAAS